MTFTHPVLVRWSDIDSYDHVNNVRYFDYFQEARIAFLNKLLSLSQIVGSGADYFAEFPCVLVSQTIDYLRPIVLRHPPYEVDVWVESVGNTSYTLGSRIVDRGGETELVYARAVSVIVAVDLETQAKRPLSETERQGLVEHVSAT
jgi:acyl-CoA thioester hydrolase